MSIKTLSGRKAELRPTMLIPPCIFLHVLLGHACVLGLMTSGITALKTHDLSVSLTLSLRSLILWFSSSCFLLSVLSLRGSSLPSGLQAPASDTDNETVAPVSVGGQSYLYV